MVIVLSMAYVAFGGLWWMQAVFYGLDEQVIVGTTPDRASDFRTRPRLAPRPISCR
jgi:hypothetical protein